VKPKKTSFSLCEKLEVTSTVAPMFTVAEDEVNM